MGLKSWHFHTNQFGGQETGTNEEIVDFICTRFKSEFPIFNKVGVNGENAAPGVLENWLSMYSTFMCRFIDEGFNCQLQCDSCRVVLNGSCSSKFQLKINFAISEYRLWWLLKKN